MLRDNDKPIRVYNLPPPQPSQKGTTSFPKDQTEVPGQSLTGQRTHAFALTKHGDYGWPDRGHEPVPE